jgi:hypothetical protein
MHKLISALFLLAMSALAQTANTADIVKLMTISGAIKALDSVLDAKAMENQMRAVLKVDSAPANTRPRLERFCKEFGEEFIKEASASRQKLTDMAIEVYTRYYTAEDVRGLIAFYESPLGRKLSEVGPKLQVELIQKSSAWGQKVGEEVGARVYDRIEAEEKAKQK